MCEIFQIYTVELVKMKSFWNYENEKSDQKCKETNLCKNPKRT